jgi:diaminopimelate decarboxylase
VAEADRRLRARFPRARAWYLYSADLLDARARRFQSTFDAIRPHVAYALKANALPALLRRLARLGLGADVVSRGEIHLALLAGFAESGMVVNGNGKGEDELDWVVSHAPHSVNVDSLEELAALERRAQAAGARVRTVVRLNPGVETSGHPHVATGGPDAKFGLPPREALEALRRGAASKALRADGIHVHVGSQLTDSHPLDRALDQALELRDRAARSGVRIRMLNLGGGFGVDYAAEREAFPLEDHARRLRERVTPLGLELVLEPGRWLVAPCGVIVSHVTWVKRAGGRRIVVLDAGMSDLMRPALYGARHRIEAVQPREGPVEPAMVVGPLCESGDVFDESAPLPPLETGDSVVLRDAGAYGWVMSSNYNGRERPAEVVVEGGAARLARAPESIEDLTRGERDEAL